MSCDACPPSLPCWLQSTPGSGGNTTPSPAAEDASLARARELEVQLAEREARIAAEAEASRKAATEAEAVRKYAAEAEAIRKYAAEAEAARKAATEAEAARRAVSCAKGLAGERAVL
jgi:hypothetical protein